MRSDRTRRTVAADGLASSEGAHRRRLPVAFPARHVGVLQIDPRCARKRRSLLDHTSPVSCGGECPPTALWSLTSGDGQDACGCFNNATSRRVPGRRSPEGCSPPPRNREDARRPCLVRSQGSNRGIDVYAGSRHSRCQECGRCLVRRVRRARWDRPRWWHRGACGVASAAANAANRRDLHFEICTGGPCAYPVAFIRAR